MSEQNLELTKRLYEEFNSVGIEAALPLFAPDEEYREVGESILVLGETRNFLTWRQALDAAGVS